LTLEDIRQQTENRQFYLTDSQNIEEPYCCSVTNHKTLFNTNEYLIGCHWRQRGDHVVVVVTWLWKGGLKGKGN